jgi:WhiB family redox-sensing transcriptional regulator
MSADRRATTADPVAAAVMAILGEDEPADWRDSALCAQTDSDEFFPEKGGSTREAKKVCGACEVRTECLEYALSHDERFGIWGGLSERERRRLKRGLPVADPAGEEDRPYAAQAAAQARLGTERFAALLEAGEKTCNGCDTPKALAEFPQRDGRPRGQCHACVAEYNRKWRSAA